MTWIRTWPKTNTLSEEDIRDIEQSIREIHEGKYCTIEALMKEVGLF